MFGENPMRLSHKLFSCFFAIISAPTWASGIPVVDAANLTQNLQDYIENLSQGVQQLTDYALQVKQYENELLRYDEMVKNRIAPAAYLYDRINNLQREYNSIYNGAEAIKRKYGDVDAYLSRYGDPTFYMGGACYQGGQCNLEQLDEYHTRYTQAAIQKLEDLRDSLETQYASLERSKQITEDSIDSLRSQLKASDGALKAQQTLGDIAVAQLQAQASTADEIRALRMELAKQAYDNQILRQKAAEASMAFITPSHTFNEGKSWTNMLDNDFDVNFQ